MQSELLEVIRSARRRWRTRLTLRGLAAWALAGLAVIVIGGWLMEVSKYSLASVRIAQIGAWATVLGLLWWWVVRAAARRVSDSQVALYLEEREPQLQGSLLAAVRFAGDEKAAVSRDLVDRLVRDAVARCEAGTEWRETERRDTRKAAAYAALAAATALVTLIAQPGFLATALPFLLPTRAAANPYSIGVLPGDTLIARGADLEVSALLRGFVSDRIELISRRTGSESWERSPMVLDETTGSHGLILFDLRADMEYLVEAAGVRSRVHTVRVADLPWVTEIGVELTFPAYTGLAPQQEIGGDIVALQGTRARITLRPSMPVETGALVVLGRDTVQLTRDSTGSLSGSLTVRESGDYRVIMPGPGGRLLPASPLYHIEALEDQPPTITFTKPGRDADATPIDEVMLEARATDDFGVRRLDLMYRVNGGPERTVPLSSGAGRREMVGAHVLLLEDLELSPGDVIAYHASATDGRPGAEPQLSDIYFLAIRPFSRTFRQAEQDGMQGGEGGTDAGELTQRQRDIVAATFRVQRERARKSETELRDDLAALTLSQGRLREEVETLVRRLRERGVARADTAMGAIAVDLDSAVLAMRETEEQLGRRALDAALPHGQRALAKLSSAEARFNNEQQVAQGNQGGGRGRGSASAEDLADLFELELDRMQNQYESVQREREQNTAEQVDEAMERLRELARRQQQEAERRARAGNSSGASGNNQRRMAEEADSLARQLERLSREQRRPELSEAARQLRDAANQMRRSAADRNADAAANAAASRLRDAQRELERSRSTGLRREVEETRDRARRLADQQDQVEEEVARLDSDTPAQRAERLRRLGERKDLMAEEVGRLGEDMERLARDAQRGQADAASRLREASRQLREGRTQDMIRYSRGTMGNRSSEYARAFEEQIDARLDSLASSLTAAAAAVGEPREDRLGRALERTRDAASALENLAERMQGSEERQGSEGSEGSEGREGREGQQGQQGGGVQPGAPGGRGAPMGGGDGIPDAQFQRQMREQLRELRDVREQLRREGIDTGDLDALLGGLQRAGSASGGGTRRAIEDLAQIVVPGLREFEFSIRRQVSGDPELPRQAGQAAVPPAYRALVEEYYRALSERRP